ncbi:MAG: adenylate/guanylate cyclase domain-containing protein [Spirulinaceae cyanobacterium]
MKNNQADASRGDILLVDDTPNNLRLLSVMLKKQGYKVRKALNGQMALDSVAANLPDLILLDISMPEMDGYEVCERLKAEEKTTQVPVIFISALDNVFDKVKAFEVGGIDYITKPFQDAEVFARVKNQLQIQQLQLSLKLKTKQLEKQNILLQQEIKDREKVENALRIEQRKSETLLLNIFPAAIAEKLKQAHQSIAEQYEEVTILFADIVGFTPLAASISPKEIVDILNQIFSAFDQLTQRHGLEKIKTIGDAYMVVGGLPTPKPDHAEAIAQMALDMQACIGNFSREEGEPFQIRIGINTGPVVAGVIGKNKFIYDLWGDAVNVASRMESSGDPGKIQVSAHSYELLKGKYNFEERGKIAVKGKGEMTSYWLV